MKPSPDRLSQIANKNAIGSRSGGRVPMRMVGWKLSTETSRCSLKMDFHNASLPEVIADYRLSESQLPSTMDMDLIDQEYESCERTASGFVDCSIQSDAPPGKSWQMKRHMTGEGHISLFECSSSETVGLANSINEPPISILYDGTTKSYQVSQDTAFYFNTFDPDPPNKSTLFSETGNEVEMVFKNDTSGPLGITDQSLITSNSSPPVCISYLLSETLCRDHMRRVQGMERTHTISAPLENLGIYDKKYSLSYFHRHFVSAENDYPPPGAILNNQIVRIQYL